MKKHTVSLARIVVIFASVSMKSSTAYSGKKLDLQTWNLTEPESDLELNTLIRDIYL